MIRNINGTTVYFACASAGRPHAVEAVQERFGDVTWHVPEDQWDAYRAEGAAELRPGGKTSYASAYNTVLDEASEYGLIAIRTDDDPYGQPLLADCEGGHRKITCLEAAEIVLERLLWSNFAVAGIGQNRNPYWVKQRTSTSLHMSPTLQVTRPCPIRYDTEIGVFSDVDFNLQHIESYGGILRCNDVIMTYKFHAKGGATEAREKESPDGRYHDPTDEAALASSARLVAKWGSAIRFRGGSPVRPYFAVKGES